MQSHGSTSGPEAEPVRRLVIVVPAFNEEESISKALALLREETAGLARQGIQTQLYVVDDGSTDATAVRAREAGADRVVRHRVNQGLGAAVRTGLTAAHHGRADVVVKFDADLQHSPADVASLIAPILDDEADIVYGNRFPRIAYRMPRMRKMGNRLFTFLMRRLTEWPVKDSQPGIIALGATYLERFHLPGDYNYTQQILLDAYHKGMRFAHVDVDFSERESGQSFVSWSYPMKVLPQIFLLLAGLRPLRVFAPIGLGFLLLGVGVFVVELALWLAGLGSEPAPHANLIIGSTLFGVQTLFFGILAHLVIQQGHNR